MGRVDFTSAPFSPVLRWLYTVPCVSIILPFFQASFARISHFFHPPRKIQRSSPGVRPIFHRSEPTDREFSPLIGYNSFPIAADHHRAGIKKPRTAASRRGSRKEVSRVEKAKDPRLAEIVPWIGPFCSFCAICSQFGIRLSAFVPTCPPCNITKYDLFYNRQKWEPVTRLWSSHPPSR